MLVVSDTSPLRALQAIDRVPLISLLFGDALVPPAVAAELAVNVPMLGRFPLADYPFLVVRAPRDSSRVNELLHELGKGEAEALALALEVHADLVLIDEARGRLIASRLGLKPTGVLAIIVEAKARGFLESVRATIDELETKIQFRLSDQLRREILHDAGEAE